MLDSTSGPVDPPSPTDNQWRRHHYPKRILTPGSDFLAGASNPEAEAFTHALGRRHPTKAESVLLSEITGCRNFGEFRYRVLSTHPDVDRDASILLVTALNLDPKVAQLAFTVLLRVKGLGFRAGKIARTLSLATQTAHHNTLVLHHKVRGRGIATHLVQSQEEAWAAAGYTVIRLRAAKDDGWKFWARQGYDFAPETPYEQDGRESLLERLYYLEHRAPRDVVATILPAELDLSALRAEIHGPLHSWDILDLGEALQAAEQVMPKSWSGVKYLSDDYVGHHQAFQARTVAFRLNPPDVDDD